ncbi:MAG: beta-ketoacyl-ACP synthase II, partial [Deltaproteobacteria bacterium]|nr:beta-ketoacyl-ACP synthase II [Deltaproteobacteria bacterium]
DFPVRFAGAVSDPVDTGDLSAKEIRRLDRFLLFALAAAREALADAGLDPLPASVPSERVGVAIGSGIGGLATLTENHASYLAGGPRRVSPFLVPMAISNMASGYVSIRHGLRGPNLCHVSACASGAHAIGESLHVIERGDADVVLAGGSEAPLLPLAVAGFAAMRALSVRNDEPARASRPFDADRDGFVMAEGAGVVVLEALDRALARGARIRAEIRGYAATADAAHLALPLEDGAGARRCMELALRSAGVHPAEVGYVNAHATSTPAGDAIESRAIRAVFAAHTDRLPVSSTKSSTGHLLGAAGAVEAIFSVRALETGWLPPTINLDRPDPACALDHVAHKPRQASPRIALSNSFGFGGTNASLVLERWEG